MTACVTPAQVYGYAAALVERGWTQKATARDFAGRKVEAFDPAATCWCVCGAIDRAAFELTGEKYSGLYDVACDLAGGDQRLLRMNEQRGQTAEAVAAHLRALSAAPASRPDGGGVEDGWQP